MFAHNTEISLVILIIKYAHTLERDRAIPLCLYFMNPINKQHISLQPNKGKAVPLQACSSPEGSRKLRFPDFMTTAQDGGKVVSLTHQLPLPPGTHFC